MKNPSNLWRWMVQNMWRRLHSYRSLMIRCFSSDDDSATETTTNLLLLRVLAKCSSPSLFSVEPKRWGDQFTKPDKIGVVLLRFQSNRLRLKPNRNPPAWYHADLSSNSMIIHYYIWKYIFIIIWNFILTKYTPCGNDVIETSSFLSSSSCSWCEGSQHHHHH